MACVVAEALSRIGNGDAQQLAIEIADHRPHPMVLARYMTDAAGVLVTGPDIVRHRAHTCACSP